jgi:hypothetical protein
VILYALVFYHNWKDCVKRMVIGDTEINFEKEEEKGEEMVN